jgi:hypothetical protein
MSRVVFALDLHDPRDGERLEVLGPVTLKSGHVCPWFVACQDKGTGEASLVAVNAIRHSGHMSRHIAPYYETERRP